MKYYPAKSQHYKVNVGEEARMKVSANYKLTMLDGKSRITMCGRTGGYCYLCSMTKEEYHTMAGVRCENTFIEYNEERVFREWRQYLTEEGEIKVHGTSKERKGWCHKPYGVPDGIVVLHFSINTTRWIYQLIAKCNMYEETDLDKKWEVTADRLALYKLKEDEFLRNMK